MKAYTDYPFVSLGDMPYKKAPIREIKIISYDGDKYCKILVEERVEEIKACYIYPTPSRCGKVSQITVKQLMAYFTANKEGLK